MGVARIGDGRPVCAEVGDECAGGRDGVLEEDADDDEAVRGMRRLGVAEDRELIPARDAPRRPEIDDDRVAALVGKVESRPIEREALETRCRAADGGGLIGRTASAEQGEDGDAGGGEPDVGRPAGPAGLTGCGRGSIAYCSVKVPVMLAWMLQANGYAPAGWADTS
jgi:hypothetical protein